jgi:hypothetical protein
VKRVKNLVHLLIGIALLAVGAYFFRGLVLDGKLWWQQQLSVVVPPAKSTKSDSASDDPILSAANVKVYGVLAQQDEAASGDDATPTPSSGPPSLLDHVNTVDPGAPNHFLHKRLSVKTRQIFAFEIPPHAIRPQLQGRFRSVATRQNPGGGAVELSLMNEEEFASFANNNPRSTTLSWDASRRGDIHWDLNATFNNPQKYYLVFRNSSQGQGPSIVDADFTASFE